MFDVLHFIPPDLKPRGKSLHASPHYILARYLKLHSVLISYVIKSILFVIWLTDNRQAKKLQKHPQVGRARPSQVGAMHQRHQLQTQVLHHLQEAQVLQPRGHLGYGSHLRLPGQNGQKNVYADPQLQMRAN
jgi:hypothetical protein